MNNIKIIVFDWDGTIVDSNALKRDVWFDIFPRHSKAYFAIQKLLPELKTITRSQILKKVFAEAGDNSLSKEEFVSKHSEIYRERVEKGVLKNGFLAGAKEVLESLHGNFPLYVNSATPIKPLLSMVKKIGVLKYFKGIYGRSLAQENHTQHDLKVENLREIAEKENVSPEKIIMIGDAEADRLSAEIFGCKFFAVDQGTNLVVGLGKYLNI